MSQFVVPDSGVFLAMLLDETLKPSVELLINRWLKNRTLMAAPSLFRYEIVATIRKSVARGRLTQDIAVKGIDQIFSQAITLYFDEVLLRRAFEIATKLNRPTAYDSQYLAVAESLGCEFWTVDEKFYNAAHE